MALSANKLAPSAVVLAFVGYCVWPSLSDLVSTPAPPKPPPKVKELAASLFSPTLAPAPTRNPWGGLDAEALAAAKESTKPVDTQSDAVVDAAMATIPSGPVDPLAGLTLQATSILGDQRMAIINNQAYTAQEAFNVGDASYRVVRVLPYKVVLERDNKILDLTYSNVNSQAARASQADGQAAPDSATVSHGKNPSVTPEAILDNPTAALESFLKKSGVLQSLLKKQAAGAMQGMPDAINPLNQAGE